MRARRNLDPLACAKGGKKSCRVHEQTAEPSQSFGEVWLGGGLAAGDPHGSIHWVARIALLGVELDAWDEM